MELFELVSRFGEDPALPSLDAIPSTELLNQHAWSSPLVFRFIHHANGFGTAGGLSSSSSCGCGSCSSVPRSAGHNGLPLAPDHASAGSGRRIVETVSIPNSNNNGHHHHHHQQHPNADPTAALAADGGVGGWPAAVQQYPLCAVSQFDFQRGELLALDPVRHAALLTQCSRTSVQPPPYCVEAVRAVRYELVATVFAVERYDVLALPVTSEEDVQAILLAAGETGCTCEVVHRGAAAFETECLMHSGGEADDVSVTAVTRGLHAPGGLSSSSSAMSHMNGAICSTARAFLNGRGNGDWTGVFSSSSAAAAASASTATTHGNGINGPAATGANGTRSGVTLTGTVAPFSQTHSGVQSLHHHQQQQAKECPAASAVDYSRQRAVVLSTVCRVISTAGGVPPAPEVALRAMMKAVRTTLEHTFVRTSIPLLGVSPDTRLESWHKTMCVDNADSYLSGSSSEQGCSSAHVSSMCPASRDSSIAAPDAAANAAMTMVAGRWTCSFSPASSSSHAMTANNTSGTVVTTLVPSAMSAQANRSLSVQSYTESWVEREVRQQLSDLAAMQMRSGASTLPLQWHSLSLPHLFDNTFYNDTVVAGWARWTAECNGGLCRALIVNSIDEIVQYCGCSRAAFFTAVAYLDRFVAVTHDPVASCRAFLEKMGAPPQAPAAPSAHPPRRPQRRDVNCDDGSEVEDGDDNNNNNGGAAAATSVSAPAVDSTMVCTYFTQIIAACAMLGCKNIDTYPPRVGKVLLCLQAEARLGQAEFAILELHVLSALQYHLQPVTVQEVVDALLFLGGGDHFHAEETRTYYRRVLETRLEEEPELQAQMEQRFSRCHLSAFLNQHGMQPAAVSSQPHGVHRRHDGSAGLSARSTSSPPPPLSSPSTASAAAAAATASQVVLTKEHVRSWQRFCCFSRFVCDLMIRGRKEQKSSSASEQGSSSTATAAAGTGAGGDVRALALSPATMAIAIIAVTAEVLRTALPAPLFRLLPEEYQARLRENQLSPVLCGESAACITSAAPNRNNKRRGGSTIHRLSHGINGVGEDAAECGRANEESVSSCAGSSSAPTCFLVRPEHGSFALLQKFCQLSTSSPSSSLLSSPVTAAAGGGGEEASSSHGEDADERERLNEAERTAALTEAINEVHACYQQCRGAPCDPILRKRYRDMFSLEA